MDQQVMERTKIELNSFGHLPMPPSWCTRTFQKTLSRAPTMLRKKKANHKFLSARVTVSFLIVRVKRGSVGELEILVITEQGNHCEPRMQVN